MILIIDGNNLAYRAKHVFSLSNRGEDVSVVYGFIRVLNSLMSKYKPTSVIVCWDNGIPDFRRQAVPSYKANRHSDDDHDERENFYMQIDELHTYALPMFGMISVAKHGAEADDLMYQASRLCVDECIIVTSDKDLIQAVNYKTKVMNPARDTLYTVDNIEEHFGVPLNHFVDWRAIQGDSSDNIPGVYGIGEKTATKLFKEYGTLTNIVNKASKSDNKVMQHIVEFGFQKLVNNIMVTALYADRVGARLAILDALEMFRKADKDRTKKYFMRKAFVSLIDGEFFSNILRLRKPDVSTKNMRLPVIAGVRRKSCLMA